MASQTQQQLAAVILMATSRLQAIGDMPAREAEVGGVVGQQVVWREGTARPRPQGLTPVHLPHIARSPAVLAAPLLLVVLLLACSVSLASLLPSSPSLHLL